MKKYILGFFCNIFNLRISKLAIIDNLSIIAKTARIYRGTKIYKSKIGEYSYISTNSSVVCAEIGKFCSIAQNVYIGLPKHNISVISTSPIFLSKINATGYSWNPKCLFEEHDKVIIGNDVWIGMNALVKGGVIVGDGAVIGAGALVTKDIPPYAIVGGIPAKIIRYRFSNEIIEQLLCVKWWNFSDDFLKLKINEFNVTGFIDLNELQKNNF